MTGEPMTDIDALDVIRRWADHMRADGSVLATRAGVRVSADLLDAVLAHVAALTAERDTAAIDLANRRADTLGDRVVELIREVAEARSALAAAEAHLDEPTRLAAARAEGYEEGAQDVHAAHIRHHDRIREIMGIPINAGSHDWRHNPARLIDTTDLRDAYDTLVVLIGEKINPHAEAARAEGYREGVEAAKAVAKRWYDSFEEGRDRATATLAHVEAARLHTQAVGISVVLASLNTLSPPPAEPAWTPTHRHYKGTLYRVTKRGKRIWAGNDERNGSMLVEYDNAAGGEFALSEGDFDSEVEDGIRRYAPLDAESAQPDDGWIEWKGGECPVEPDAVVEVRMRDGRTATFDDGTVDEFWWGNDGCSVDIIAYRIVKPAEPSAPVAPDWPTRCAALEADGISARKRIATLKAENAALRERAKLVVAALHGPGASARQLVTAVDGLRALLQGGADAATV